MATLELYLIRHGVAAERGADYPDDSKRPLTSDGIVALRKEAKALGGAGGGFRPHHQQPAGAHQADGRHPRAGDARRSHRSRRPTRSRPRARRRPSSRNWRSTCARRGSPLVGHEPNIGELAARLIGSRTPHRIQEGAICRIDFEVFPPKGHGTLRWFVDAAHAAQARLTAAASAHFMPDAPPRLARRRACRSDPVRRLVADPHVERFERSASSRTSSCSGDFQRMLQLVTDDGHQSAPPRPISHLRAQVAHTPGRRGRTTAAHRCRSAARDFLDMDDDVASVDRLTSDANVVRSLDGMLDHRDHARLMRRGHAGRRRGRAGTRGGISGVAPSVSIPPDVTSASRQIAEAVRTGASCQKAPHPNAEG